MRYRFIFLFVFVSTHLFAQSSDYLIVENPFELRILNKFEQSLGQSESAKLYPFMPLEIISRYVLLSDHLTTGIKVKSGTDIYILLSDADGQPVNINSAGAWKIYYGVKAFSDTITILQENAIGLYPGIIPASSANRSLRSTEKLLRIFSWDKWAYVYSQSAHEAGWVSLGSQGELWNTLSTPKAKLFALSELESSIQGVVNNTNFLLRDIYEALNKAEKRNETAPQWVLKKQKTKFICAFVSAEKAAAFDESINALKGELENALAGAPVKIHRYGAEIEIVGP